MGGNKNSGRPGGNPDIKNIRRTGPKTPEGKLKSLITSRALVPKSKSKVLNMFKFCDKCPLRGDVRKVPIRGTMVEVSVPSKCSLYEKGQDCRIDQGEMIRKLSAYFKIGELGDTMQLQRALTYGILENAEIAKQAEMVQYRKPGFFTARFQEIASKNLTDVNKLEFGEKHAVAIADVSDKISQEQALKIFVEGRGKVVNDAKVEETDRKLQEE